MAEHRRLAVSTAAFGAATALSRVAGLVRESVAAAVFGAGPAMSAFNVAFNLPNLVRSIVADNAISGAFVPVFLELREERPGAGGVAGRGHGAVDDRRCCSGAVSALFMLAAPLYVHLLLYGQDNVSADLVVTLTRILFPIVAILGMTGVVTGILNSERIFGVPAFAPVAWNLVIILALVLFARGKPLDEGVEVYAWGVLVATVVQFLIPLPLLRGRRHRAWPGGWGSATRDVRRILRLMIPVSIGLGLININLTLDTVIADPAQRLGRRRPELRVPAVHAAAGPVLGGRLDRAVPRAGAARGAARPGRRRPDRLGRRRGRSSSCCCRPPRSRSCWRSRSSACCSSTASSRARQRTPSRWR